MVRENLFNKTVRPFVRGVFNGARTWDHYVAYPNLVHATYGGSQYEKNVGNHLMKDAGLFAASVITLAVLVPYHDPALVYASTALFSGKKLLDMVFDLRYREWGARMIMPQDRKGLRRFGI